MPLPEPLARAGWLIGLPALALVWAGTTLTATPQIAARIEAAGSSVADATGTATTEPWLRLAVRGRDLVALGEAPDVGERETVLERLAALDGMRRIVSEVGLVETAAPFVWALLRTGAATVALEGSRPVELGRRALEARVAEALPAGTGLDDTARAARGAPTRFAEAATFLAARLAGLARGGRAAMSDTVLGLSGEALDLSAYDALRAALAAPPAGFTIGRVEVLPPTIRDYHFAVEKVAGGLVLDGALPTEPLREAARAAAAEAAAGGAVEDRSHTARGLDPAIDPKALIGFVFRMAELIQAGRVAFADGAVSVNGDAIDGQAIPEAADAMRDGRPAGVGAGPVVLAAKPLSPYRTAIRRTPEGVVLTGHLPDAAARERVLAALRPRLFREPITDRTRLADGAPPDLAAVLAAVAPSLVNLAAGEVAVSDRTLRLTGESLYREAAARAPERLAAALPAGWSATAVVIQRDAPARRDPASCRGAFSAAIAGADLRFPTGSASLAPGFYPVLDALAALAKACPSLRIAVAGPADPAKAAPAPPPATAPAQAGEGAPAKVAEAKAEPKTVEPKAVEPKRAAEPKKTAAAKPASPPKGTEKNAKPEPEAPAADLPQQRAAALIEYLLQAGARPEQLVAGPDGAGGRVAFAMVP